jgi:hypothetical protein
MSKVKTNITKRLTIWAGLMAAILMIPFLTNSPWTSLDYISAAVVLFGSAACYEIAASKMKNKAYRLIAAVVAIGVVMSLWALAVSGP